MDHYNSNETAEKYDQTFRRGIKEPKNTGKAIERYNRFIQNVRKSGPILDAGCGTGRFVSYFNRDGFKVTGIDSSQAMINIAIRENPNVDFYVMDMRKLKFQNNQFDGIWNSGCILHLDEDGVRLTFSESKRVLNPGGVLFVSTRTADKDFFAIENSSEGGNIPVNYYSTKTLQKLLTETGFEVLFITVDNDDYGRPFDYCYILYRSI